MAVLDILVYPDPRLKQVSRPVEQFDETLRNFIGDLEETMRAGPGGVGIAAPQVGRFERIVIVDVSAKPKIKHHGRLVLINPVITSQEGSVVGREGCLSRSRIHRQCSSRQIHLFESVQRVRENTQF